MVERGGHPNLETNCHGDGERAGREGVIGRWWMWNEKKVLKKQPSAQRLY